MYYLHIIVPLVSRFPCLSFSVASPLIIFNCAPCCLASKKRIPVNHLAICKVFSGSWLLCCTIIAFFELCFYFLEKIKFLEIDLNRIFCLLSFVTTLWILSLASVLNWYKKLIVPIKMVHDPLKIRMTGRKKKVFGRKHVVYFLHAWEKHFFSRSIGIIFFPNLFHLSNFFKSVYKEKKLHW